jgi:hypothetical protein
MFSDNNVYILYFAALILILFLIIVSAHYIKHAKSFKCFSVSPLWYKLIAGDSVKSYDQTLRHTFKNVQLAGRPDALFRHRLIFWKFLLCELKSRRISNYNPRVYDIVEVLLDAGLVKKNYLFSSVNIVIKYKDSSRKIKYNSDAFKQISDFMILFHKHKISNNLSALKFRAVELNMMIQKYFF